MRHIILIFIGDLVCMNNPSRNMKVVYMRCLVACRKLGLLDGGESATQGKGGKMSVAPEIFTRGKCAARSDRGYSTCPSPCKFDGLTVIHSDGLLLC
jgi:hypothetical protein